MIKFSANLSLLFTEVEFPDRFEAARKAGFRGVEFMFPYGWEAEMLAEKADRLGLEVVLHNLPSGNWEAGERGIACLPGREEEFRDGVELAIKYARTLKCSRLNCLSGLIPEGTDPEVLRRTLVCNLRFAAAVLEKENILLLIEPVNDREMPGMYLKHTQQAINLINEVNHPNIRLQYDVYHMQVMEGNLINTMADNLEKIGHIQIADNPGRHEPGTGEINFENIFSFIDRSGYTGWTGCEYKPSTDTENSLGWFKSYISKGEKSG